MNIVVVGHVDHGKSTLIGKLLVETGSLPVGKIEQIKAHCERTARVFEYAFLLDALKAEQSQGITIEVARIFFKTKKRNYIMIDAPGHVELLKNMITGAARAEAALLVIDAKEGAQETSRRHAYLLSMLGIKQIAVIINKMDLAEYSENKFQKIVQEFKSFLKQINITPAFFIPASGIQGDSIVKKSERMTWYSGPTLVEALDRFNHQGEANVHRPFRMPVQDVYKFTQDGDDRRIIAGTVESGSINVGDEITFYPSGNKSKISAIASFNSSPPSSAKAGKATGFVLADPILVKRGDLAARSGQAKPHTLKQFKATLFWLGVKPFQADKEYLLKIGTSRTPVKLEKIERSIDATSLTVSSASDSIARNGVAECILTLTQPISVDLANDDFSTSRFVIVDQYEIAGGGTISETLIQPSTAKPTHNKKSGWKQGSITSEMKKKKYGQKPGLILLVGSSSTQRNKMAKALESQLFKTNRLFYSLYQKDAQKVDLETLSSVCKFMFEAGLLVMAVVNDLAPSELKELKSLHKSYPIYVISLGRTSLPKSDLKIEKQSSSLVKEIIKHLAKKKILL